MVNDDLKESETPSNYSRLGVWDKTYQGEHPRRMYGDPATAKIAGGFLNQPGIVTVEDWGCGYGGFAEFLGPHQQYVGVDGSQSKAASKIVDLVTYKSNVDAIHMRHIIEHNDVWQPILRNALSSFTSRMVLTLFTPYQPETKVLNSYSDFNQTGNEMIDIGFARDDIVTEFDDLSWFCIENIVTDTQYNIEHMFFLTRAE